MEQEKLLSRDEFRESVFKRDNYKCVICDNKAQDAHHIIERRLWEDQGYYLSNGASLCAEHHIKAETTEISPEDLWEKIGVEKPILPEHLYSDQKYTKWGDPVLSDSTRLKGELFYDESVQKILAQGDSLHLYKKYVKYPRTYHLSDSKMGKDDKMLKDDSQFVGRMVVMTEKQDGENTTMYNDYIHARSIDSGSHESRSYVKRLWAEKCYLIDDNMRICGENLYAKHSIKYNNLKSYFSVFSIWENNLCLDWKTTKEYAEIIGFEISPVLYEGIYDKEKIFEIFNKLYKERNGNIEGFVIRLQDEFTYGNFKKSVAKYVHPEFRQIVNESHGHWISKKVEKNELIN